MLYVGIQYAVCVLLDIDMIGYIKEIRKYLGFRSVCTWGSIIHQNTFIVAWNKRKSLILYSKHTKHTKTQGEWHISAQLFHARRWYHTWNIRLSIQRVCKLIQSQVLVIDSNKTKWCARAHIDLYSAHQPLNTIRWTKLARIPKERLLKEPFGLWVLSKNSHTSSVLFLSDF